MRTLRHLSFVVIAIAVSANAMAADSYQGSVIIKALERSLSAVQTSEIVHETRTSTREFGKIVRSVSSTYTISRSDGRLDIQMRKQLADGARFKLLRSRRTFGEMLLVRYNVYGNTDEAINGPPSLGSVTLAALEKSRSRALNQGAEHGFWLDGYLSSLGKPVYAYLLDKDAKYQPDSTPSPSQILLQGDTKIGQLSISLDPECGFLPSSIVLVKSADDLVDESTRVDEIVVDPLLGKQFESIELEVTDIEKAQVDGEWLITSGTLQSKRLYDTGNVQVIEYAVNRVAIELEPTFGAGRFHTDLPQGSPITFTDEIDSEKSYVWNGQWPELVVTTIQQPASQPSSDASQPAKDE